MLWWISHQRISLRVLIVSLKFLQHTVRSSTAKLREWPWQWVARALRCFTNNLVAAPDFFLFKLLDPLDVFPLKFWWLNLNKIYFITFTTVPCLMISKSYKPRRGMARLPHPLKIWNIWKYGNTKNMEKEVDIISTILWPTLYAILRK